MGPRQGAAAACRRCTLAAHANPHPRCARAGAPTPLDLYIAWGTGTALHEGTRVLAAVNGSCAAWLTVRALVLQLSMPATGPHAQRGCEPWRRSCPRRSGTSSATCRQAPSCPARRWGRCVVGGQGRRGRFASSFQLPGDERNGVLEGSATVYICFTPHPLHRCGALVLAMNAARPQHALFPPRAGHAAAPCGGAGASHGRAAAGAGHRA